MQAGRAACWIECYLWALEWLGSGGGKLALPIQPRNGHDTAAA